MFADTAQAAASSLRPLTIAELGALFERAAAVERELCDLIPADALGVFEFPLMDAITQPASAVAALLLELNADTDGDLLIQARARKHVHGSMA